MSKATMSGASLATIGLWTVKGAIPACLIGPRAEGEWTDFVLS